MGVGKEDKITCRQGFYGVDMRATGSTSAQWGPDDTADGLHPVFHIPLGAGHEQERLRVGWHLLPLCGTTCETGRQGLLQGSNAGQHSRSPPGSSAPASGLHPVSFHTRALAGFSFLPCPHVSVFFCVCVFPYQNRKSSNASQDIMRGMPTLGQLGEAQSLLQLQGVLLKSVTHCV